MDLGHSVPAGTGDLLYLFTSPVSRRLWTVHRLYGENNLGKLQYFSQRHVYAPTRDRCHHLDFCHDACVGDPVAGGTVRL